jgi:RNA polymerase sigma factor FliA
LTGRTLGRLWRRYLEARVALCEADACASQSGPERRVAERKANVLRDRLLVNYTPLVKYVAGRVSARMTYPLEQQDILAWGVLGLLDAVETYDPERGTKFETYAISKIRWSILDELRKADPLPRRLRLRAQQVEGARGALAQKLGRSPTEREIVRELGVDASDHRAFLVRCHLSQAASLEAKVEFDGVPHAELHELVRDHAATDPALAAEISEVRARLIEAILTLSERERLVTSFYFYEGLTLREIGKSLGLTEGRISQILRRALTNLRETLAESRQVS